jgi:hypothetical protein
MAERSRAQYVQLETGDDVSSVRDRLSFVRGQKVLLIWPENGTILTRKLDLVLIQREAMRRAIRLALVTHDAEVVKHATELNISTFETIGSSERGRWRRGRSKVFTGRFQRPQDEPIPDDLKDVASRIYSEETAQERRWKLIRRAVAAVVFVGVAAAIGYVVLPSATVQLVPAQTTVDIATTITASPQSLGIDIENRIIPSTQLSVQIEDNGTLETSGVQAMGEAAATGSVVFINQTEQAVTIPASTTVTTSGGNIIQFRTMSEASLPGGIGLQIEVPIEALTDSAGAVGNVDAGTINTVVGPLASAVTVRNIAPTGGGSSRTQRTVTQGDQDRLLATVRQQLQNRAYVEMQSRISASQCIILETVRIVEERSDWQTFSAQPDEVADTLSLDMRAVVEAVVVDEQFGQQVVYAQLSHQVQQGQSIIPQSVRYDLGCESVESVNPATGEVVFEMTGSGTVIAQIDADQVRSALVGRPLNDAIAYLVTDLPLQAGMPPQITVWPEGWTTLPLLSPRISIQIQETPLS